MDGLKPLEFTAGSSKGALGGEIHLEVECASGSPEPPTAPVYPTDLDDMQWEAIAPLIPPGKPVGITRTTPMRAVVNAILYRARCRCSWRMLPRDFPHWRTVYGYQSQWQLDGTWQKIRDVLRRHARRQAE